MPAPSFVHLRLHSEYSVLDSTLRIDDAVAAAAADGMPALAITDLSNAFGLIKFYRAARAAGIKPIAGCDVWITNDNERDLPYRAILLAANRDGYLRLCEWLSRAFRTNQHRGRAELRRDWLDEGTGGLIALSGGRHGDVGVALLQGNAKAAERAASAWSARFPNRYYLEVQRAGQPDDDALVAATVGIASELALPVVATHPVQFASSDDFRAHEARVCIAEGHVLADTRRPRRFTTDQYFKTQAEMAEKFADLPQALANSVAIAQRCNLTVPLGKNHLPEFPTPPGVTIDEHLRNEASAGLERRLAALYPEPQVRDAKRPEYVARLDFETATIVQMGFAGYFLIVADYINWAKRNRVPVGPGRGSGAGSLVAYALGITDLDPLRYALLFERFLNPERVSMPDFDIDFCQNGRDRVIEYVKQKYGADSVSQIATFGTLAAKAAVRDVGRVLDLPYPFVDGIAKLIPFQPGKLVTLKRRQDEGEPNVIYAREVEPLINERESAEEEVHELLALAEQLEGLPRNVGMHAGGVLIAPGKLTDFCPLYVQPNADAIISQFDKDDVEAVGLVKFDFLGLTTLTILDWTLR
jgi:DNA polymerase-3 subunit alpha